MKGALLLFCVLGASLYGKVHSQGFCDTMCPSSSVFCQEATQSCICADFSNADPVIGCPECADNNGGCSDVCVETFSGFTCECSDPGFEVGPDEVTCVDIDECLTNNGGCEDVCTNTDGSFTCSCPNIPGSTVQPDGSCLVEVADCPCGTVLQGQDCVDIDECADLTSACGEGTTCINTDGSFVCISCPPGSTPSISEPGVCEDIDECAIDNGGCGQICNNEDPGFFCSCNDNFILAPDGFTCQATCPDGWIQVCNKCYNFFDEAKSWDDAEAACAAAVTGGHLVSIHSRKEHCFVKHINEACDTDLWIGLNDKAGQFDFVWSDDSSYDFSKWGYGEPNNLDPLGGYDADCARLKVWDNLRWADASCTNEYSYICQAILPDNNDPCYFGDQCEWNNRG